MIFGDRCSRVTVTIGNSTIGESDYEKLLGVIFDKKLSFRKHVEDLCKKPTRSSMHLLAYPPTSILLNLKS